MFVNRIPLFRFLAEAGGLPVDGTYGFVGGGSTTGINQLNTIDYFDKTIVSGNAADKGDLTTGRHLVAGNLFSATTGFFAGGGIYFGGNSNVIDYIDLTSISGNATDRGNLLTAALYLGGTTGEVYGFIAGGASAPFSAISYIDLTTTSGNAASKGTLSSGRGGTATASSLVYGFFSGGTTQIGFGATYRNIIDYIDNTTIVGNATDRGDLTVARYGPAGVFGDIYGFCCGGYTPGGASNVIDYYDMVTLSGNALDRGNLTVARMELGGCTASSRGFCCGGSTSAGDGSPNNTIDYFDIETTSGNAIDRGNLNVGRLGVDGN